MRIVAGQPIRRQDHHGIELTAPRRVPQTVQGRAIQSGAADAIIGAPALSTGAELKYTGTSERV